MKPNYYPGEIAEALAQFAGLSADCEATEAATAALYQLKAICENPYNADYFRGLYSLLEAVTDKIGVTIPF